MKESIKLIGEYLEKLPKKKVKEKTMRKYLTKVISYASPFLARITVDYINQAYVVVYSYVPVVLLLGSDLAVLPASVIFSDKMAAYVVEKNWLKICFKKHRIFELRDEIIQGFIDSRI